MNENLELIQHIYKDSEMGEYTITELLTDLKEKDNKIKESAQTILNEYQVFLSESREILEKENCDIPVNNLATKIGSKIGIMKEVKDDNSDSSIADMLIKGISMGSIEMEKKVKVYKNKTEKEYMDFANKFLKFQAKAIDDLKKYL